MSELKYTVEHLGLAARDPSALKDWYVRVLGATVIYDNGKAPPTYYLSLADGTRIEIYKGSYGVKEVGDNNAMGWRHLAVVVPSLDEARLELMSRGVIFNERIKAGSGGGTVLFFQDSEGNLLHLVERPPEAAVQPHRRP